MLILDLFIHNYTLNMYLQQQLMFLRFFCSESLTLPVIDHFSSITFLLAVIETHKSQLFHKGTKLVLKYLGCKFFGTFVFFTAFCPLLVVGDVSRVAPFLGGCREH